MTMTITIPEWVLWTLAGIYIAGRIVSSILIQVLIRSMRKW